MPHEVAVDYGSKQHERLRRDADERFRFSEDGRKERDDISRRSYKAFRGFIDEDTYPMPTKISVPKLFSDVMTQVGREMDSICAAPPILRFFPRGRTPQQKAQDMENACGFFLEQMPLWEELCDALLQRRLFGTVYLHPHWRTETRWMGAWQRVEGQMIPLVDPMTGQPINHPDTGQPMMIPSVEPTWSYVEGERETYDGPWFSTLHLTECFPDHAEKYVQDGEFFIVRKMRDARYLKRMAKLGVYNKAIVKRILDENAGTPFPWDGRLTGERLESTQKWQEEIGFTAQVGWKTMTSRKWFEVLEHWTHDGWVVTIVNGSYVVRYRRNPYAHGQYPFIRLRNYFVPGEHYGMPDYELGERLYMAYTDMVNAGCTQAFIGVFPPVKADKTVDTKQLRQRSIRDVWKVDGPDQVLEFMQVPQQSINFAEIALARLGSLSDNVHGLSEPYRGGLPESTSTPASTITSALQGAGQRLKWHIDGIGEQGLRPLGDQWQHMIRQLCSRDLVVRVFGDPNAEPLTIPIMEMRDADFVCSPLYPTAQAWLIEQKRNADFYELIVRTQEPNANRRGAYIALVESNCPRRKEQLIRSEADIQREQMAAQQQQMAQQQMEFQAKMSKFGQAQDMAAEMGRQADQSEAVIRGAQAQGRAITEFRDGRTMQATDPAMEELQSELGEVTERYL